MKKISEWLNEWIMVIAIFVLILLLAFATFATEQPKFIGDKTTGIGVYAMPEITYSICDICERKVPDGLFFVFRAPKNNWNSLGEKEFIESMKPYALKDYRICWRCIYEKLGFKPESK